MRKVIYLLGALILSVTSSGYALSYSSGPYLGGQIGWGRIDEGDGYKQYVINRGLKTSDIGNFIGFRVYGGYSFLPFLGIEGGYSYYPENTYSSTAGDSFGIKSYTIDLVAKVILPFTGLTTNNLFSHFSVYGKGGGAYVYTKINTINGTQKSTTAIRPTYGAGIIYSFTDNIAMDLSWTSILGRNRATVDQVTAGADKPIPNGNLTTLGFSYKFTGIF